MQYKQTYKYKRGIKTVKTRKLIQRFGEFLFITAIFILCLRARRQALLSNNKNIRRNYKIGHVIRKLIAIKQPLYRKPRKIVNSLLTLADLADEAKGRQGSKVRFAQYASLSVLRMGRRKITPFLSKNATFSVYLFTLIEFIQRIIDITLAFFFFRSEKKLPKTRLEKMSPFKHSWNGVFHTIIFAYSLSLYIYCYVHTLLKKVPTLLETPWAQWEEVVQGALFWANFRSGSRKHKDIKDKHNQDKLINNF